MIIINIPKRNESPSKCQVVEPNITHRLPSPMLSFRDITDMKMKKRMMRISAQIGDK